MAYTQGTERKTYPRLFVGLTPLSESERDSVISSGEIPNQDSGTPYTWNQVTTMGGASLEFARESGDIGTDQVGTTNNIIDNEEVNITVTLSSSGFEDLVKIAGLDPNYSSGDYTGIKDNRGVSTADNVGISMLLYGKDTDQGNDSDKPDASVDPDTLVLFKCANTDGFTVNWNNEQNTVELTFRAFATSSAGSSDGYKGATGTFTNAS